MSTNKPQQQPGGLSVPVDAQQLAVVHEFRDVYQQWQASDSYSEQSDALGKRVDHLQMRLAFILDALVEQAEKAIDREAVATGDMSVNDYRRKHWDGAKG